MPERRLFLPYAAFVVPDSIALAGDWHGNTAWAGPGDPQDGRAAAASFNWATMDVAIMRWLHFAGRPISNAVRGLTGLLGASHDARR
jgi:hypothetical protein